MTQQRITADQLPGTVRGSRAAHEELVEADLVDCMIALPGQLFYTTQIPVCLWFLARDKSDGPVSGGACRDRRRETLFIDARQMGALVDRTHKELSDEDIARIAGTYHAWRGEVGGGETHLGQRNALDLRDACHGATAKSGDVFPRQNGSRRRHGVQGVDPLVDGAGLEAGFSPGQIGIDVVGAHGVSGWGCGV